ncbi:MAG: hypothetical protein SVS15_07570, partial [Thermodesulfobacteriota bacterium]|nr:hypothetical protein [Thermodesulfobacteriota bacterium]
RESDLRGYYADETQGRFPVPPKPEPVQQESSLVPQDIRSGFEPAIKDSVEPQEAPPDNYFHLNGDLWEIHYEGETCHLKDFDGMRYIKILLDGPQGGIKTTELYHAVHYSGEIEASLVDLDLNDTEESTKNKPFDTIALETTDVDEIMDPQTSRETQERLKAIKIELVSVQHDGPKREALKEEKKKILAYLEDGFAQKRFRKFIDEQERSRKKVSAAIKRALKKMKAACPKTGTHFTAAIKTGVECSYKPNQPTSWGARPLKK